MKKCFFLSFILFINLCFAMAQTKEEQWEYLFNGKNLNGFKQLNGHAKFVVENGEIIGTTVLNEPSSFLATEKKFTDFILEVDFKANDSINSGIQFRSEVKDLNDKCHVVDMKTPERVHGYQMEIDPTKRKWSGGIFDEARRGWLYPMEINPDAKTAFKNNQWNHCRIECIGTSIRTWLNGVACAHLIDDMTAKGFIALQIHAVDDPRYVGKNIRWKNIRIQTRNLQASPDDNVFILNKLLNNISACEKRAGIRLLWDGKTTEGWRGANKDSFPTGTWYIQNGTLNVIKGRNAESQNGGDILTKEVFGAFDLQFEFQLSDSANSGVKYFVTEKEKTKGSAIGLEYQILDDAKHPDAELGSIGNRTQASLYDLIPVKKNEGMKRPIGAWNLGRIVVYPDGRTEHWLNGWKVLEYQRGAQYFYALVAKSKFEKIPDFGMAPKGHILLQEHGTHVAYRNIKIKELK